MYQQTKVELNFIVGDSGARYAPHTTMIAGCSVGDGGEFGRQRLRRPW